MSGVVERRLDELERKLRAVERELREVRALALEPEPAEGDHGWARIEEAVEVPAPPPPPPPPPRPAPARPFPPPREWSPLSRPQIDLAQLLSAKALAWAGGAVSLLGIVFLFVLAVERGWIGPEARVALGGAASVLLAGAGILIRRRFGHLHSALGAVGAGIAGAYATLLAATALYELVPRPVALLLAAAIAAFGVALSTRWWSELVAGLGLLGAMLVPAVLALDSGLTRIEPAFAVVVFVAAVAVAVHRRWNRLLVLGACASAPQVVALAVSEGSAEPATIAIGAVYAAALLGSGIAHRLRSGALEGLAGALVLASGALVLYASEILFGDVGGGIALLVAGAAYGAVAALLFARSRDLSSLVAAVALALGAVGVAELLSGPSLTYVWAAEAAVLAWLARRLREIRVQALALAYLGLAAGHSLLTEASPDHLFTFTRSPATGLGAVVAGALAAGLVAVTARPWAGEGVGEQGIFRWIAPALDALRRGQSRVRLAAAAGAALLALYALALGVLGLFQLGAGGPNAFHDAHVLVAGLWGLAGLVALLAGIRRSNAAVEAGAVGWLALVLVHVLAFEGVHLDATSRSYAFLAFAGPLFLSGFALERLVTPSRRRDLAAGAAALAAGGLSLAAVTTVVDGSLWGISLEGLALGGVAAVYATFAAVLLRRRRDYSTLLWTVAAAVAAAAEAELVDGQWLVAVWAGSAAAAAGLATAVGERRLRVAALGYLVLALVQMLADTAPLRDFFTAGDDPGAGVPSVLAVAAAALALALTGRAVRAEVRDELDRALDRVRGRARTIAFWGSGAIALYAVSLAVLELFELGRPGSLGSSFQSGHTVVSALWGLLGLGVLYLGLRRRERSLQLGGFALFGLSLAKLFLYDLAQLSSITRALSFLAVGALLLLAGFFYQRLTSAGPPRAG